MSGISEVLDRLFGGARKVLEDRTLFCKADLGVLGRSSLRLGSVVDCFLEVIGVPGLSSLGLL